MKFNLSSAQIYVPDDTPVEQAYARTTHLAVSAHQDDLEIMAAQPVIECFQKADKWFSAVVATDGRGSPRADLYANFDDEQMHGVRIKEQKKAAYVGEYSTLSLLDYPSKAIKDGSNKLAVQDLGKILEASKPEFVFTHNLADKHDTHVGTALKVIEAIRNMPAADRPKHLYGCEVWRDLDWMIDEEKVPLDVTSHENLQAALLGVYDSQICGGKRYDLSTMGRRKANATYFASHGVDTATGLNFAMDMTPLIQNPDLDIKAFVQSYIDHFAKEVHDRISKLGY